MIMFFFKSARMINLSKYLNTLGSEQSEQCIDFTEVCFFSPCICTRFQVKELL